MKQVAVLLVLLAVLCFAPAVQATGCGVQQVFVQPVQFAVVQPVVAVQQFQVVPVGVQVIQSAVAFPVIQQQQIFVQKQQFIRQPVVRQRSLTISRTVIR